MGIPLRQVVRVGAYVLRQHLQGDKRYPLVLMLEPLFRCNLACAGCGKIDYPDKILNQRISVEDASRPSTNAARRWSSIAGGEPLLHKEMPQIVEGIIARKKFVDRLHQRAAARKEDRSVQAEPVFHLVDPSRRRQGDARQVGLPGRRLRQGRGGDQVGQGAGLPRHHQLHALQRRRAGARGGLLRRRDGDGRRRHHRVAGLCLRARARPAALPQPQQDQGAVPRHLPARARRQGLGLHPVEPVPRLPGRQPDLSLHALGQSDPHGVRLAEALLPARRRLRQDLQGTDGDDRLGRLRRRQLREVRRLHGPLRLRGDRRTAHAVAIR